MKMSDPILNKLPEDLEQCVSFHGHLCPGLIYGYLVARESIRLLDLERSKDEEVVAVSENDSCAVDALQVMLGTSTGKGNLILKDYGKNAYSIFNRGKQKAYRFSRKKDYHYTGNHKQEFALLEQAVQLGIANEKEKRRQRVLKAEDLLAKTFDEVFATEEAEIAIPPYAPLAPSKACAECGEMTMATKMITAEDGSVLCVPCSGKKP